MLHVEVHSGAPLRACDVAQSGAHEHQRGTTVREAADDARAPADLAHDALHRIVGADAPPMLLGEGVVRQGLVRARPDEIGGIEKCRGKSLDGGVGEGPYADLHAVAQTGPMAAWRAWNAVLLEDLG